MRTLILSLCSACVLLTVPCGAEEGIKEKAKEAGQAVADTAVKVGHATRDGAKQLAKEVKESKVGEAAKEAGKKVGETAVEVGHAVKEGAKNAASAARKGVDGSKSATSNDNLHAK